MTEQKQNQQLVTFTLDEVNQMLGSLGEVPSKYAFDLINFIRGRAQSQLKPVEPPVEQSDNKQE